MDLADRLRKAIKEIDAVKLAYLFGSWAEGDQGPMSDVDLAILASGDWRQLADLQVRLSSELGLGERLRVLDLKKSGPSLLARVIRHGVLLVDRGGYEESLLSRVHGEYVEVNMLVREGFRRWLKGDPGVDERLVAEVIARLQEDVAYLSTVVGKETRWITESEERRRAFERALHTAIESIIDLLRHLISAKRLGVAEAYQDYVDMSRKGGIITQETATFVSRLVALRHSLVHRYRGLDYEELKRIAAELVERSKGLLAEVKEFVKRAH